MTEMSDLYYLRKPRLTLIIMEGVMTGTRSEFVKEFNENAVQFLWNWGQNCKFYSMSVSKVHHLYLQK